MSDKQNTKNPRTRQHQKPVPKPLTAEEQAAALAAKEKAQAEAKAERERVELYGKSVEKMSHRQLRKELTKTIRRESVKEGGKRLPIAGLNIAMATIFLTVLDNTKTAERLRPDQINPNGKLHSYPL
jgi:hypothetical protein